MVAAAADFCYCSAGIMKLGMRHLLWGGYAWLSVRQGMLRGVWQAESVEPSWWARGLKYSRIRW